MMEPNNNKTQWEKVQRIFDAAIEIEQLRREEFLQKECGNDFELYNELLSLLQEDENINPLLKYPVEENLFSYKDKFIPGKRIGIYKIIDEIGSGGMGSVFLAERSDGEFEQKVALKLIKPGMDSLEILKRFKNERQILARLQHPNIARLFDGGITEEGYPFFTMEYVDGLPVDEFCDKHCLSIKKRLTIFQTICNAVQYAHRNLIIHRDLKPNNILITPEGTVKLLDFGIAKVLTPENEPETQFFTQTGFRLMTPEYASPEQIKGETITTSSDVYSLGLILYRLLTGFHPFKITSQQSVDIANTISNYQPKRPSTIIFSKKESGKEKTLTIEEICKSRNIKPERLKKILSGDIDNICLTALRKEPDQRYSSAEKFSQDIENYLTGIPVTARPANFYYRTKKFIKRHRIGFYSFVFVFTLITALIIFYTLRLTAERDKANLEAQKSMQVSKFLSDLFKNSDPYETRGENITAREILDKGAAKIQTELKSEPDVQAKMLDLIGNIYSTLGLFDYAEPLIKQGLDIRKKLYGEDNLETAESIASLGALKISQGQYEQSELLLKKAIKIREKLSDFKSLDMSNTINFLAILYNNKNDYKSAEALYKRSIEIKEELLGENTEVSILYNNIALLYHETGRLKESDSLFKKALTIQRRLFGLIHPEISTTLYNYSQLLRDMGSYESAEIFLREAIDMDTKLFGEEHPATAYDLNSLAMLLNRKGNFSESENLFKEVLNTRYRLLGNEHPDFSYSMMNYADLLVDKGNYTSAESLYTKALINNKKLYGDVHKANVKILNSLGTIEYNRGNHSKAKALFNNALKINKKIFKDDNQLSFANCYLNLSMIEMIKNNLDSAEVLCSNAFKITNNLMGDSNSIAASIIYNLGKIYFMQNKINKASESYTKALKIINKLHGPDHPKTADLMISYGDLLTQTGKAKEAEPLIKKSLDVFRKKLVNGNWRIYYAESILGNCLRELKQYSASENLLLSSFRNLSSQRRIDDKFTREVLNKLIKLYLDWGKKDKLDYYNKLQN